MKLEEQRAFGLRIVAVVHQLRDEPLRIVRQQFAGFKVESAVHEVQQKRIRVELVRRDRQLALGHREHVADAPGIQGAVGERAVILVFGLYRLGQVLQHGLLRHAAGGALIIDGPPAAVPHEPLAKRRAIAQVLPELQDQAVGVPGVIAKLFEQSVLDRLRRFHVRVWIIRGCRRQLHRHRVGHDLSELIAAAANFDPIPEVALRRQSRQPDDLHFGHVVYEGFGNDSALQFALLVAVNDDADRLPD